MNWRTKDFDYELPAELIAARPAERRDGSRMMVVDRSSGKVEHRSFADFGGYVRKGDLCVLNDTRVVRSRFFSDDGKVELVRTRLLGERLWKAMVRPGKRMKAGREVVVGGVRGVVIEVAEDGERVIEWEGEVGDECGALALPHYMERDAEEVDEERYQTVYAKQPGAIAAPTAGLHFT
ncbi:MAG: S-adenosylmethionine:tRNA ribosyltransferase-isomerase, partial [Verrucomicrobiales bacterium]|nr:S-adenosylmethionine:tRNA ribosyltransferase-isomerase [Verrucomicrobiales bacterium]